MGRITFFGPIFVKKKKKMTLVRVLWLCEYRQDAQECRDSAGFTPGSGWHWEWVERGAYVLLFMSSFFFFFKFFY